MGDGKSTKSVPSKVNTDGQRKSNYVEIFVPTSSVGYLIGKAGCNINNIEYKSGAKITVKRHRISGDFTNVELSGNDNQINRARILIKNYLERKKFFIREASEMPTKGEAAEEAKAMTVDKPPINWVETAKKAINDLSLMCENMSQGTEEESQEKKQDRPPFNREDSSENFVRPPIDWERARREYEAAVERKWAQFPPIVKELYQENPEVAALTRREVEEILSLNNNTTASGGGELGVPNPVKTFRHAFEPWPELLAVVESMEFPEPTPVQAMAWPCLLRGQDIIAVAQTGTGKTLAFLLPGLVHIRSQGGVAKGPRMLVLAPTRELAMQIEREVIRYPYQNITTICLYGGTDREAQVRRINNERIDVVIATPGRLNDLVSAKVLNLNWVTYLVLDEADRMLDMGFEPQIRKVLMDIRPNRQTVMTSATWPSDIRRLASSYTNDPVQINVGSVNLAAVETVSQIVIVVDAEERGRVPDSNLDKLKLNLLLKWVGEMEEHHKVIIFCGQKIRTDYITCELAMLGLDCLCMHGGREQEDRELTLAEFINGTVRILVATDLASRGLDVVDVTHVINFDVPRYLDDYVHRVGRTGRAGRSGVAITYITSRDWACAADLIKVLEQTEQPVPPALHAMAERYEQYKLRRSSRYRQY